MPVIIDAIGAWNIYSIQQMAFVLLSLLESLKNRHCPDRRSTC